MPTSITRVLIEVVSGKRIVDADIDELLENATRNKVLLHVLRVLGVEGDVVARREKAFRKLLESIEKASHVLEGLHYSFYKLVKPVIYVPADIDILIDKGDIASAIRRLSELGYRTAVREPFTVTLTRGSAIIDLYVHPSMGGMVYLDGSKLLEYAVTVSFHGISIPSLPSYAEALVAAAHATYKEMLYTLNDYVTVKAWNDERTAKLATELRCKPLLDYIEKLNKAVEEGLVELPYRIPLPTWMKLWSSKAFSDRLTRSTIRNAFKALASRRGLKLLKSKLTRETY